jgi:hypothetical protein
MKIKPVRWTVEQACSEFDINPRTLSKRLKGLGTEAGEDGKFSTRQITRAVFSDLEMEQARLARVNANIKEVEEARVKNKVLDTEIVFGVWENIALSIRRTILTSGMTDAEKDSCLVELKSFGLSDYVDQKEFTEGKMEDSD